jgi:hypothetical protein
MASGISTGNDNPLSQESNPNSVETAAADFSAMLADEGAPAPKRRERDEKPAARSPAPADDTGARTERQPSEERTGADDEADDGNDAADPILDDTPPDGEDDQDNEDGDEADDQDDADDQDEDEEDDQPEDKILQAKVKIQVNGVESEVTVQEARDGYMRQADYTQGTERNAREYEEVVSYATETVQARQRADQTLEAANALIEALQPSKEDWDALRAGDPKAYIAAQEHWNGLQEKARQILASKQQLAQDGQKDTTTRTAKYYQDQEAALLKAVPALRNEKKAEAFRATIKEYGLKAGYTEEELIKGAVDHRDLLTLYKAAQYDKTRASISAAGKRAGKSEPKAAPTGRPRVPNKARNAGRNADRRLARTGSVHDAAESFAAMIRDER